MDLGFWPSVTIITILVAVFVTAWTALLAGILVSSYALHQVADVLVLRLTVFVPAAEALGSSKIWCAESENENAMVQNMMCSAVSTWMKLSTSHLMDELWKRRHASRLASLTYKDLQKVSCSYFQLGPRSRQSIGIIALTFVLASVIAVALAMVSALHIVSAGYFGFLWARAATDWLRRRNEGLAEQVDGLLECPTCFDQDLDSSA
ncbi:unnamed protein product, partial [Polarella glacialis]